MGATNVPVMTALTIRYLWGEEQVSGVEVRPGVYRLTSFSEHLPLVPGDEVSASGEDVVTGVERLADDVFVVEAYFKMYVDERSVALCAAEWSRDAYAQQSSALTVSVAASLRWLEDRVRDHPDVARVELIRLPGQTFSFREAVRNAQ